MKRSQYTPHAVFLSKSLLPLLLEKEKAFLGVMALLSFFLKFHKWLQGHWWYYAG